MLIVWLIVLALALGAQFLDAHLTDSGIRKGLFVEGSSWCVDLWSTNRPKFWQLIVFNLIELTLPILSGTFRLFGDTWNRNVFCVLSIGCLGFAAAKFAKGAYKAYVMGA